jgi:hypothetical protein
MQSIEAVLRNLDRRAQEEREESEREQKALAEYGEQMDRPFEHEARLKGLLARQAQLNAALDLDKNERQVAPEDSETQKEPAPATFAEQIRQERAAELAL